MQPTLSQRFKTLLTWFDNNFLLYFSAFLLVFIPLYPKIPTWSPIEQYIVRVRLEDFFILLAAVIWGIQFIRQKVRWRSSLTWMIVAYEVVSLISVLTAVFIIKTVPLQYLHVTKTLLHYFRYIEYFSLFFVFFSAIRKPGDVKKFVTILALVVIAITIYGYGQRYYYWPVYSTMNREFSKGMVLYLTPHARVQSTFAGDYDMAAYLVIALPLLLALYYRTKDLKSKLLLLVSFWMGGWLMIESASRVSFAGYLVAMGFVILFTAFQKIQGKGKQIRFILTQGFIIFGITSVLFLIFGADLQDRLAQVMDSNPQIKKTYDAFNAERKDLFAYIARGGKPLAPPPNSMSTDQAIAQGIITPSDSVPVPSRPADVYADIPDKVQIATVSASGSATVVTVEKPRTFSPCALADGLSLCIRLDTLWPRAIKGFLRDPLFGSGYATLNKESLYQFTEAESTDNNFLRTLGETGLLGFVTFYGCVAVLLYTAYKSFKSDDPFQSALAIGLFCGSVGLLINAVMIDVYASSKVAQTYWALAGMFFAYLLLSRLNPKNASSSTMVGTPDFAAALASTTSEASTDSVKAATPAERQTKIGQKKKSKKSQSTKKKA